MCVMKNEFQSDPGMRAQPLDAPVEAPIATNSEPSSEGPKYYGKDCPAGMVQVEFVGCSPDARYSAYGWKPVDHAFIDVYVDGRRFRINIGSFHDGVAERRGLHIVTDGIVTAEQTSMNAASMFFAPRSEAVLVVRGAQTGDTEDQARGVRGHSERSAS